MPPEATTPVRMPRDGGMAPAPLQALLRDAQALAERPSPALGAAEAESARQLQICNACRYCEGFCAVFPAMARRLEFGSADLHYLANLCHQCGACLHACQYAPPHAFAVSLPRALSVLRRETYARFAWPSAFAAAYRRNGLVIALALAAGLGLFLALAAARQGTLWGMQAGSFYAVFPHGLMVGLFAPVFGFALLALAIGVRRFWRQAPPGPLQRGAVAEATGAALSLRYLDGGHGEGCNEADDRWTLARRRWHHLVFHGFLLCFAATALATVYHYALGRPAPYPLALHWSALPKLLGTAGGLGLVAGCAGLWRLRRRRHPEHLDPGARTLDEGFIALLFATGASGLLLAALKTTPALPLLLCLHLGCVMAFFLTMPYGKFAHGVYRCAALLKWAIERRLPPAWQAASE
jgi:citrate/tricarballylate utilization protein